MRTMKTMLTAGAVGMVGLLGATQSHAVEEDLGQALERDPAALADGAGPVPEDGTGPVTEDGSPLTEEEIQSWVQACDFTVYTDHVDRQPTTIFGAATVDCDPGYLPRWGMTVDLFEMRGGGQPPVHLTGQRYDCTSSPCSGSSGLYTITPGNTQYCARVGVNDMGSMSYVFEQNCTAR